MNNALILTDNPILYERVKAFFDKKNFAGLEIDFRHSPGESPLAKHPDFYNLPKPDIDVNEALDELCLKYNLIISIHCLQFFPARLVKSVKCINLHPGYNPINRGWYPQIFAIINDLLIGATIHEMDEKLDHGFIIARELVPKYIWDTSETLYNRILEKEMELFENNFEKILHNNYQTIEPELDGNFFNKKDFQNTCRIDIMKQGSFLDFYNHLRALTH